MTDRLEAAWLSKHNEPLTLILTLVTWTISLLLKNMLTLVFPSSVMYAASTETHTWTGTNDKTCRSSGPGAFSQTFTGHCFMDIRFDPRSLLSCLPVWQGNWTECLVSWTMTKSMLEPHAASDHTCMGALSRWTLKKGEKQFPQLPGQNMSSLPIT